MNKSRILKVVVILVMFAALALVLNQSAIAKEAKVYSSGSRLINEIEPTPFDEQESSTETENSGGEYYEEQPGEYFRSSTLAATTAYTVTLGAWRNLRPTESYLRDVSMLSTDYEVNCSDPDQKSKGWIVGDSGVILNYCNGVWDHAITVESVVTDLNSVQAISPTLAVAVGEQGSVLMYLWDRIALDWVWTKSPIPVGNQRLYAVSMIGDASGTFTGWAVGEKNSNGYGALIKGTINPTEIDGHPTFNYTWENVTNNYPDLPGVDFYNSVQMLSKDNAWAVGGKDGVRGVIIHWNGVKWSVFQEVGKNLLLGLHMVSENEGWAVGRGGVIYHFNGISWDEYTSPTSEKLIDVTFDASGTGWIVGESGMLLKYQFGNWAQFTDLRTDPLAFRAVDFTSGHGWLVGLNNTVGIGGHILEYDDDLWLAVTPPTDNRLNDVSVVSDNNAWAVGSADTLGGTIVHWDGKHWQRWYQYDLPLPPVDLFTIDMVSEEDGWAAGKPDSAGEPAIFLHWDGHRWAPPRYDAPINVRVNDIAMLDKEFGWAVANDGNAIAKYDGLTGYWSALHSCQGIYYQLRSSSIIPDTNIFGWDAWAVGSSTWPAMGEHFLRYMGGCGGSYAWDIYQTPQACEPDQIDGGTATKLFDVQMRPGIWGFAAGNYRDRASIYYFNPNTNNWNTDWCMSDQIDRRPSRFYSVDIVEDSGVAWFGGYYWSSYQNRRVAFIRYYDAYGSAFAGDPFPINGRNIYDRPILSLEMSSDTMGWAVGASSEDVVDSKDISVIYQYPYPNFTLDSYPFMRAVMPGRSATFTVTVNTIGGFNSNVQLEALSLPTGISATITPDSVNSHNPSLIEFQVATNTTLGTYEIPLVGYSIFRSGDNDIPVWRIFYLQLTVTEHPVYEVSPRKGSAGTLVSISGENFGPDPGVNNRSTDSHHILLAGARMNSDSVVSWSDKEIQVRVPDDPVLFPQGPTEGNVQVLVDNSPSNSDYDFLVESHIATVDTVKLDGYYQVTILGTGFGNDPGSLFRSTSYEHVTFTGNHIPNGDVLHWGNNQITFQIPEDSPSGYVSITANGYESNSQYLTLSSSDGTTIYLPSILAQ